MRDLCADVRARGAYCNFFYDRHFSTATLEASVPMGRKFDNNKTKNNSDSLSAVQKAVISYGTTSRGAYVADVIMKYVAFPAIRRGNLSANVNFVYERESDNST